MRTWMIPVVCLSACSNFTNEVYWVELTEDPSATQVTTTVEHNFSDAQPMEDEPEEVEEGVPVTTVSRETSPDGFYVLVRRGADGVVFVNFLDQVLTGRVESGVLEADWDNFESFTMTTTFDALYTGQRVENTSLLWSLMLQEDEGFGGTFDITVADTLEYSETDEWDSAKTSIFSSTIPASTWLESTGTNGNTVSNQAEGADCTDQLCLLSVTTSGLQRSNVVAFPAGIGGYEYFGVVQDFAQSSTFD